MPSALLASLAILLAATLGAGASTQASAPAIPAARLGETASSQAQKVGAPWSWPLDPVHTVLRRFQPPATKWAPGHRGADLESHAGEQVLAPRDGVVSFSGVIAGRGVVVIAHAGGLRSTFEPVRDALPAGDRVTRGQPVAAVAEEPGHCRPGVCLHWGLLRGEEYLDPLAFVGWAPVRLLPLGRGG